MEKQKHPLLSQEDRQELAALAKENGWTLVDIGEAIGTTGDNVGKLLSREGKRSAYVPKMDVWLRRFAHLKPNDIQDFVAREDPSPYAAVPEIEWLAGQELITLGKWFQSRATTDWKLEKYEAFIKAAFLNLEDFRSKLQKPSKE